MHALIPQPPMRSGRVACAKGCPLKPVPRISSNAAWIALSASFAICRVQSEGQFLRVYITLHASVHVRRRWWAIFVFGRRTFADRACWRDPTVFENAVVRCVDAGSS